jgi:hypothetical protein
VHGAGNVAALTILEARSSKLRMRNIRRRITVADGLVPGCVVMVEHVTDRVLDTRMAGCGIGDARSNAARRQEP